MLAVTIEVITDGDEARRRPIAAMRIEQVSVTHSICEYVVDAIENADGLVAASARFASCVVEDRERNGEVWDVVENACRAIIAAERGEL